MTTGDDRALFEHLYPGLRRFAAAVAPLELDPDDLVQEALVRALERGGLGRLEHPGAYLRTAMVHIASNERRSLARRTRAVFRLGPAAGASFVSDLEGLAPLLPLSVEERAVLYLTVVEQCTYREAGQVLGGTEEALRARASRALRRLRAAMRAESEDG